MHWTYPLTSKGNIHYLVTSCNLRLGDSTDEHSRLEPHLRIRRVHPHFDCSGHLGKDGINKRDGALEALPGVGFGGKLDLLAVTKPHQVRFVSVQPDPHLRQIGNGIDPRARIDVHAFLGVLVDDDATTRRIDRHVVGRRASFLDLRNLFGLEPPQSKLLSGSYNGSLGRFAHDTDIALGEVLDGLKGLKEFLLGTE